MKMGEYLDSLSDIALSNLFVMGKGIQRPLAESRKTRRSTR